MFAGCQNRVSLLLTDFLMPIRNGRELYERLLQKCPTLKVMYMSGHMDLAAPAMDPDTPFLAKPFTPRALAEKDRQALEGAS